MELLELMKTRRSIRKFTSEQITETDLNKIIEAGLNSPNAGGRQGTFIVGIHNKEMTTRIGKLNLCKFSRKRLEGSYVSGNQPSVIDDPTIKNGFYDAPCVCVIFGPKHFLFSIPDCFCSATQMTLEAHELGIASCIISRGEETFDNIEGQELLQQWNVPPTYIARAFVILGYVSGDYPGVKKIKDHRSLIVK